MTTPSLKLGVVEVFEYSPVVVILPLFIGLLDSITHLLECALEHVGELLTHVIDLLPQPLYLVNLLLLDLLVLLLDICLLSLLASLTTIIRYQCQ